jgi:hypothetical protein
MFALIRVDLCSSAANRLRDFSSVQSARSVDSVYGLVDQEHRGKRINRLR